jgi:hypothetical protein
VKPQLPILLLSLALIVGGTTAGTAEGNPSWLRQQDCSELDDPEEIIACKTNGGGTPFSTLPGAGGSNSPYFGEKFDSLRKELERFPQDLLKHDAPDL